MTRLSRMVLGTTLIGGLAASTARAADPDKLLPAEADTVVSVNIKQVLGSEIIKKYAIEQLKTVLDGQDAKKLLGELGLDPLNDIEKVVVGAAVAGKNDTKYLMIVHGKFNAEKLYKAAEAQSKKDVDRFSMIKDGKTVMFKYQPENGENPVYGTVVNEKLLVAASDKKLISTALKAAEGDKKAPIKPDLAELVKKMDEKSSFYAVGLVKGKFDEVQFPPQLPIKMDDLQKLLPMTESMSVAVKIGADVNVDVTLGMKDEDSAGDMRNALDELLKQVKPLALLAATAEPRAKPLGDILNTVKTSLKNKDVSVSGKVTGGNIGKMIKPDPDGQ